MKKVIVITTAVVCFMFIASISAFSRSGNKCEPAGTWRGGSSYDPNGDPYDDLGDR